VDTWFVSGLQGSGSKDIEVAGAFVPAHRVLKIADLSRGESDGWRLHARATYRLPIFTILGFALASPIVGMAQGVVDEFVAFMRRGGRRSAESAAMQLRLAESSAEVDAARVIVRHDMAELIERGSGKDYAMSPLELARFRRDAGYVVKLSVQATNRLFEASGGGGLYRESAIQRLFRDVNAASHHAALSWDTLGEAYGKAALTAPNS
jgi:alkylation response protein AidB-like acyl-CoA dehydrogenase